MCGVDRLVLVVGRGAVVRWPWWALENVLLAVCIGVLDVGWCGVARPGSSLGCCALLARALTGPLARLGFVGLVGVEGRRPPLSTLSLVSEKS